MALAVLVAKKKTSLAALKTGQLDSFVAWMLSQLVETKAEKGDLPGHEFHGNQWTGGQGAKPTETSAKDKTAALKELLSSGHSWGISEIAKITGASTTYVAKTLKAMEGVEHNGLVLTKEGSGYKVVKASGEPYAPHPKVAAEKPEPAKPTTPPPVDNPKPVSTPGVAKPPETIMDHAQATAVYQATIANAIGILHSNLGEPDIDHAQAVLDFKDAKALAMAQFTANTQGVEASSKPQSLFTADALFAGAMKEAATPEAQQAAFGQWKSDTAAEKNGSLNPQPSKNAPPVKSESTAAAPTDLSATPFNSHIPTDTVPSSHVGISAADFATDNRWATGMNDAKAMLLNGSGDSAANKQAVAAMLTKELAGHADYQAVKAVYDAANAASLRVEARTLESRLVANWATTSGDNHPLAIAMQLAVQKVFNLSDEDVTHKVYEDLMKATGHDKLMVSVVDDQLSLGGKVTAEQTWSALQAFIKAQYAVTQKFYADRGVKEVYLARGMHAIGGAPKLGKVKLQPASSFSADYYTARTFAGAGGSVFMVKVPVSQILGTYRTGYGCTREHEVVVVGNKNTLAVKIAAKIGFTQENANAEAASTLKGTKS